MPTPRILPELLDPILDLVRGPGCAWSDDDARVKNSDLLSAALVCREWADAAQRVLWRDARVTLDQDWHFPSLPSSKYPIKHLWISVRGFGSEQDENTASAIATDWTNALLEKTPQLHSLCMTSKHTYPGPHWSFLRSPSLRDLKRLDLEYCAEVSDIGDVTTPLSFHLTHLGLTLSVNSPSSHLLRALFAASRGTLTSFRVTYDDDLDIILKGFFAIAPQLEKLDIEFRSWRDSVERLDVRRCVTLTRLGLLLPTWESQTYKDLGDRVLVYLEDLPLPATLTHLAVGVVDPQHASQIMEHLSRPALAQLKQLELPNLNAGSLDSVDGGSELLEECERRSIRVVFREDLF